MEEHSIVNKEKNTKAYLKNFRISIFGIIWYKKGIDEAKIVDYLNMYRQEQASIMWDDWEDLEEEDMVA